MSIKIEKAVDIFPELSLLPIATTQKKFEILLNSLGDKLIGVYGGSNGIPVMLVLKK